MKFLFELLNTYKFSNKNTKLDDFIVLILISDYDIN